jgi:transposase
MGVNMKKEISLIYSDAAGIDIGSEIHYVCVPRDRDSQSVRKFGCFTSDLNELANWLSRCKIKTVAMESTGVYWIPVFQLLETRGFEVILVNARHVKNVPGRKTDVQDCQWLQQLHSYGLLRGSFRPNDEICVLRSYIRQRTNLMRSATSHIHRMQKALTQMNLQLHRVISDIVGMTGVKIIEAILNGERDPWKLASLRGPQIKKDQETIAKALGGDYREEHLFSLKQEYDLYNYYQTKITECDKQIEQFYQKIVSKVDPEKKPLEKRKSNYHKSYPKFNLRKELYRTTGVDLTKIPGLDVLGLQTIFSEVGFDMNKWSTEKHFASWLGLSPANKITGEKIFSTRTRKVINRAATAFRLAAHSAMKSHTALGAYGRRLKTRLGAPKAITATARKLACLFYRMMKFGGTYVEKGMDEYEKNYKGRVIKNLTKKAKDLGFVLVKNEDALVGVS